MNNEILKHYFTDQQMAVVLGITLGGLRNKVYRRARVAAPAKTTKATPRKRRSKPAQQDDLPESTQAMARCRLWHKEAVRTWLLARYEHKAADDLMTAGENADPGSGTQPTRSRPRGKTARKRTSSRT